MVHWRNDKARTTQVVQLETHSLHKQIQFLPRSKQIVVHYKDTLILCTINNAQHINRLYGQEAKIPNVKTRGTRVNHCILKCLNSHIVGI